MNSVPGSILICSIRVIGDVILTTPLIGLLKDAYPDAAIDVMVAAGTGSFLQRDPRVRTVLEVSSREVGQRRSLFDDLAIMGRVFRHYDLAINMNASDRGTIAVICAGRTRRVGFCEDKGTLKNAWKNLLLTTPAAYDTDGHTAHLCKLVAEALGIAAEKLEVKIFWNDDDETIVRQHIGSGEYGSRYFVIHPFARWDYKYWPMEFFVTLSDMVARQFGLQPVWTASPATKELTLLEQYAPRCSCQPVTIRGEFSLNQMACLIAGSSFYLGLDTAVSHIAASTGVPMIALYGPTAMHRWFPWNNLGAPDQLYACQRGSHRNGHIVSIQKSCEHPTWCSFEECVSPCMSRIEPEEVFAEAVRLLYERGFQALSGQQRGSE
jgi:heptosyltransferase-3